MIFPDKLQMLRKSKGITQESLAESLQVSRQAVTKWESGQSYPDIMNLIQVSKLFHVTVDYLVKDEECGIQVSSGEDMDKMELILFLLESNQNTYAGYGAKSVESSRPSSIDYIYEKGNYYYIDSYVGSEIFSGETIVYHNKKPIFTMNYSGRVLTDSFSGDFLKEALRSGTVEYPYRGPSRYDAGDYYYQTKVLGNINWFQGYEEIYHREEKAYECYYHGGLLK